MSEALWRRSASDLAAAVRTGEVEPAYVRAAHRERIERWNPEVNALLAWDREEGSASQTAPNGALAGVPVVVKDNLCTEDFPTTCGSRILEGYRPPYDATVVSRLRRAGAHVIGKANCDEFAMGSSNENSAWGATRNPYDLTRVPGGSSGGSAVAVRTGMSPVALGSETGGSVRQPAAFTGLVGLKPTYGRLSRYGLVAFGSSLDQVGVFARNVRDAALTFSVCAGSDPADMTSLPDGACAYESIEWPESGDGSGRVLGVPTRLLSEGVDASVRAALDRSVETYRECGVKVREIELADPSAAVAAYYLIATAEASSNLARFDGVRYGRRSERIDDLEQLYRATRAEGFGDEVKRRILLGTFALSSGYYEAYYAKALRAREWLRRDLMRALEGIDAIVLPVTPSPPFRIGERTEDPLAMYLSDLFTILANLAGVPAMSVPVGFDPEGLPQAVQLMGPPNGEESLFALGAILESGRAGETDRWPALPGESAT